MPFKHSNFRYAEIRDADSYHNIRTPQWASHAATKMVEQEGYDMSLYDRPVEVRTGQNNDTNKWEIITILFPKEMDLSELEIQRLASIIDNKIEKTYSKGPNTITIF